MVNPYRREHSPHHRNIGSYRYCRRKHKASFTGFSGQFGTEPSQEILVLHTDFLKPRIFSLTCLTLSKIIAGMRNKKNPNAQALGSLGGRARAERLSSAEITKISRKGGKARAAKLTASERSRIAKLAVAARERKRKGKS